jgi:glycerophosphoryl diester phosphodiesterase
MRIFAHRGCPDRGPENTVAAVRRAAPHVDAVEIDVRRCASGELVVFHDETLHRLLSYPGGRRALGRVGTTDLQTLSKLRVDGSEESVPTLAEMAAAVDTAGLALNVELKERGLAADVVAALDGFDGEVLVSSFDAEALFEMRETADYPVAPIADSGLLGAGTRTWARTLALADDLEASAVHPSTDLLFRAPDPSERVAAAHEAGLTVNVWTVRSPDPVSALRAAGVDGLIVDDWAVVD